MAEEEKAENRQLVLKIARIFDEVRTSHATHVRRVKELVALRSSSPSAEDFCGAFCAALTPVFDFNRKTASAERVIKFVASFSCSRAGRDDSGDDFLESFLRFLLKAAAAANNTARFRACQIISEIIMRLPDDAEVGDEVWDEVIDLLKLCTRDKVSAVRSSSIRALARFVDVSENEDILDLFLENLELEQNGDVRKIIVLSMPPSAKTLPKIIDCTLDVAESVRKAAYAALASKFPLQSLSIKLRTTILQRGLADRSPAVAKECLKLMRDEWLKKCCNGDPVELLRYLDVETYESVGELVIVTLLREGLIDLKDSQTTEKILVSKGDSVEGKCRPEVIDAETALFWRMVTKHLFHEAHTKGTDAAMTMGAESEVYAAEALDSNCLLDRILPDSVSEYIELFNAHLAAGSGYRFVSRQLLLLGAMLDYSDTSNRKVASEFVEQLLHMGLDHETDENGNEVIVGDGFSLGGDREWSAAVAELTKKVHAAAGEFEEVVCTVVEELARPCRERTAGSNQWLHCLAVIALLLENVTSFRYMQGRAFDSSEILNSLLLPGIKQASVDVQRASIRCLGLFALLEKDPSESIINQLKLSFTKGAPGVTFMASKALLDLAAWHGPDKLDKATTNCYVSAASFDHEQFCDATEYSSVKLVDLLLGGLRRDWSPCVEAEENHSIRETLGEGLAKILILSRKFEECDTKMHHVILASLVSLYFSSESDKLHRLKQCLSVFFEIYTSLSSAHKESLSKSFVPAIRSLWPGLQHGNSSRSNVIISSMRKRAVQASLFMLQMMRAPLFSKDASSFDSGSGEEGLAIRIAVEVASYLRGKKTAAERSYLGSLCRVLVLLEFRVSEQNAVKLLRRILNPVHLTVAADRDVAKELRRMAERLRAVDRTPDEMLSVDQCRIILGNVGAGKLELSFDVDEEAASTEAPPHTPFLPPSIRSRRRAKDRRDEASSSSSSGEEELPIPATTPSVSSRSQRASKTVALSRITAAGPTTGIDEEEEEDDEDDPGTESDVTCEKE
ncbi:hypothetical protein M569_07302 [Genlisea aurea]|uniref:Nuclear condensin complex subunit 3 C-terminal domain-containing protein n=1 Tax=Genlisea aurea TaxID=192259 RepID=S8E550_9LAMI|nr:hypothetical protein M569_07302 [Genlisea aurea]